MDLRPPPAPTTASRAPSPAGRVAPWLTLAVCVAGFGWLALRPPPAVDARPEHTRDVAAKLKAAGAIEQAAALYGEYVRDPRADAASRARVAYSVGQLYLESGRAEDALRWFYEAESLDATAVGQPLAEKIVHALERLGRVHAAQAALASRVGMPDADDATRPSDDPVVARIGTDEIHRSDVVRALDDLPPQLREAFTGDARQEQFLRRYVADELVWRKAQKLEYERDPEIQRQLAAVQKQLIVARFIEREVLSRVQVSDADLETYFRANIDRYRSKKEGEESTEPSFAQVRGAVERDYRRMKAEAAYKKMIDEQLAAADVELFAERMQASP